MRYKSLHKKSYPKKDLYKKRFNKTAGINHIQDLINTNFAQNLEINITDTIKIIDFQSRELFSVFLKSQILASLV